DTASKSLGFVDRRPPLRYDLLSLGLGSEVPVRNIPGLFERYVSGDRVVRLAKPIAELRDLRESVTERLEQARRPGESGTERPIRIVVIGGGVSGCEIAANLLGLIERLGGV